MTSETNDKNNLDNNDNPKLEKDNSKINNIYLYY